MEDLTICNQSEGVKDRHVIFSVATQIYVTMSYYPEVTFILQKKLRVVCYKFKKMKLNSNVFWVF